MVSSTDVGPSRPSSGVGDDRAGDKGQGSGGGPSVTILLSQFTALRNEIGSRSQAQATMVNLSITAVGILGGLGLSQYGDERLLLLIPIVSTLLGLIWLDHAANIFKLGDFIREQLMPRLIQEAGTEDLPDYEKFIRKYEGSTHIIIRAFMLPPLLAFIAPSIMGIIVAFKSDVRNWLFWLMVIIAIIFVSVFIAYWRSFVSESRLGRSGT
jgi:hypothetical protein